MSKWLLLFGLVTLFATQSLAMSWDGSRSELSTSNNEFAFDLYHTVTVDSDANLVFSPYSISQAGAMLYSGARNDTATQIADTQHYTLAPDELATSFGDTNTALNSQGEDLPEDLADGKFQLNIVNSVWAQQGYPFSADYLATLQDDFNSEMEETDFESNAEAARLAINDWISEKTAERLQDVIPEGALDALTRLVLVNAIYFKATWQTPFVEDGTYDADFTLLDGETTTVDMMQQNAVYQYYIEGENYTAVSLPYIGSTVEMLVIVPDNFAEFEANLDAAQFADIYDSMDTAYLNIEMPRFEFKYDLPLKSAWQQLGMTDVFDAKLADLTGMVNEDADERLYVSDALHSAFIKVDEQGTEAAAVTVVIVSTTSAPMNEPVLFRADRPFIFAIYDSETDMILFLGRVMNPNQ